MAEPDDIVIAPGRHVADAETFAKIFRRYYAPLVRYAYGITGDAATAADVLQDVFLKLWRDRERIIVQRSLQAMLYTMVRNRALNLQRRAAFRASRIAAEEALAGAASGPSEEQLLSADDLRRHLHRWIDALPARRREAFTLSRYHGLRHAEIAHIMGVSTRTVDTHIVLALRELRRRLDALETTRSVP